MNRERRPAYRTPRGTSAPVEVGTGGCWWTWFAICALVALGVLGLAGWAVVTLVKLAVHVWGQ